MYRVTNRDQLARSLQQAITKLDTYAFGIGDRLYHDADGDKVKWTDGFFWTDGFWPGLLWLVYEHTRDTRWADVARSSRHRFLDRLAKPETHDHDLGFLFSLTGVAEYLATGKPEAREMALAAARSLASRFREKGRFIQAWNQLPEHPPELFREVPGKMIIDGMMNLPLLWWAARETGDDRFSQVAHAHARTSAKYFFRPDGSTCHTFNFDPESGKPVGGKTHQGYADNSAWARGNAWALCGFTLAYLCTGDPEYLETAEFSARFWLNRCPMDGVPPWDFDAPGGAAEPVDASAAAVAACGLLDLARVVGGKQGERYREFAERTLISLGERHTVPEPYLGIIDHSVGHMPNGYAIGVNIVYADYFYVEGLLKALGQQGTYWCPNPVK